ncbi:MAG TPA: filamentous hemagglutinin N-terminal domain-containing protein, partial [Myxococcales bacterium]|nr:filamentous hemagglutinin N-terminal domain-containing protein [Myxococcales bacterium]
MSPGVRGLGIALCGAALLASGQDASAVNILRRAPPGGAPPASPSDPAAAAAARAQAAALQANGPLRRALEAIRQWQAAQDAARAAAQAGPADVPNGLGPGGLELAPGMPPIGASDPSQTARDGRIAVTVTQSQPRAILSWNTFNVGRETDVHFDQTAGGDNASSWVALNRVVDPNAAPSRILGSIKAEGQVYIINRNGIIFGGTSQVNVGSLVVSGLDIAGPTLDQRNQRFLSGTLFDLSFAGPAGPVTVEAGAQLGAADSGRVVLLGGRVVNGGSIEVPDGQVILAAGSTISLGMAPDLSAVRGLAPPVVSEGGLVDNSGIVSAPRGNITLVAADTRQDGMLTATTGGQANGSIYLGADGFTTTFGPGSVTQVLPDLNGKKVVGSVDFRKSRVEAHGDQIDVLDGATLYVPSGDVSLSAVMTKDPRTDPAQVGTDDTRVYIGSGARIDVSGLLGVEVPMEQNTIRAELRANELRDDPLLRNNPALRGQSIWFDGRLGVNGQVADVSGYYDLIAR